MKRVSTRRGPGQRVNNMGDLDKLVTQPETKIINSGHPAESEDPRIERLTAFVKSVVIELRDVATQDQLTVVTETLTLQLTTALDEKPDTDMDLVFGESARQALVQDLLRDFPVADPMARLAAKMTEAVVEAVVDLPETLVPAPAPEAQTNRAYPNKSVGENEASTLATIISKETTMQRSTASALLASPAPVSIADMIRAQAYASKEERLQGLPALSLPELDDMATNRPGSIEEAFMAVYAQLPELDAPSLKRIRDIKDDDSMIDNIGDQRECIMGGGRNGHCFIYSTRGGSRRIMMRGADLQGFLMYEYTDLQDLQGNVALFTSLGNLDYLVKENGECSRLFYAVSGQEGSYDAVRHFLMSPEGLRVALAVLGGISQDVLDDEKKTYRNKEVELLFKPEEKKEDSRK